MQALKPGVFFGDTGNITRLDGVTLSATEYTHPKVDWHYHENAYFTYLLIGKMIEGNKRAAYHCSQGTLLFHNWQEPHYNIKPDGYTRGFHVEIQKDWFDRFELDISNLQGSISILEPYISSLFQTMYRETLMGGTSSAETIHALLLQTFQFMSGKPTSQRDKTPIWVERAKTILHDSAVEKISLEFLAHELTIHPVHLCRDFHKHFGCTFGEYIRKQRIEQALTLLPKKNYSLTDIAFECGYADQSHFIRSFKQFYGLSPSQYRKLLK